MLNVDFFLEELKTKTPEEVIRAVKEDALVSCRIVAMQKWRINSNGEWRAACLSIVKAIKVLEGYQEPEGEEDG
jgi:hypothetical protein